MGKTTKKRLKALPDAKLIEACDGIYEWIRKDFTEKCIAKGVDEREVNSVIDLSIAYGKISHLHSNL